VASQETTLARLQTALAEEPEELEEDLAEQAVTQLSTVIKVLETPTTLQVETLQLCQEVAVVEVVA
jgi:hypothetical protein